MAHISSGSRRIFTAIPSNSITRLRLFSSTNSVQASPQNHYQELGVDKKASKKDIQSKFYELSRIYHPDAPSTSTSDSIESRTARFQAISQSYAILSDDRARRDYDQGLNAYGGRSNGGSNPRYTSGSGHEPGNMRSTWSPGENSARRERANYAWQHPTSRHPRSNPASASSSASSAAGGFNPFSRREGNAYPAEDHYHRFATRDARMREQRAAANGFQSPGTGPTGTEGFGAKAEEESRLINDSGLLRSLQVLLVFGGTFIVASMFSTSSKENSVNNRNRNSRA